MTDDLARAALDDTFTCLSGLARDAVRAPEALARVGALRRKHPGLVVDLVWEESAYAKSIHYDALLRTPGAPTVSLSVCPPSDTPWPLRGARLASDQDLVRVNGETLKVRDALESIDFIWNDARIVRSLIDLCLIEEAVKRWGVEPKAEHTQRALDAFRSARGLLSSAQTLAWMEANDLTHERFEQMVHGHACTFALRDRIIGDVGLETYWDAHAGAFDVAHVSRLRVHTRNHAEMLAEVIRRGGDFYAIVDQELAARRHAAMPRASFEIIRRRELSAAQADAIFSVAEGGVAGPLACEDGGFDLVRVIRVEIADSSDRATRDAVSAAMFEQWLSVQRRSAVVEWFAGPALREE